MKLPLGRTPLLNVALDFTALKAPLLHVEAHCPKCDRECGKEICCPECKADIYDQKAVGGNVYEKVMREDEFSDSDLRFERTPISFSFRLPLTQQLECRLDGMFLQHVVDFNDAWEKLRLKKGEYSGDLSTSQSARDLNLKKLQDLSVEVLSLNLLVSTTGDSHSVYETFDFACKFMFIH